MINAESVEKYVSEKIIGYEYAVQLISEIKAKNKTVGLSHGGFDLLHPGHINHFESAKKLCDVLIVSITSDKFVGLRKGRGRPIFTERLRAYMIASIKCIDYVVISDFNTGIEVIKILKPSFYIKGPDYANEVHSEINAEREAIKGVGGKIKYTDDPKLSTTDIIRYIKNEVN